MRSQGLLVLLFAILLGIPASAGKKKGVVLYTKPSQKEEIPNLWVPAAAQKCQNWSWASGVEAVLKPRNISLSQNYWIQKAYAGEICVDQPIDFERLVRLVNGNYTLDDGRKVHLEANLISGAPTITDDLIAPIRRGEPTLLFWKWRAYVLAGAVYDELIYPNGQREFVIHELKLIDPYTAKPVSFLMGTDDPNDINGFLQVTATFAVPQPWIR